jgi:DNA-binding response OmpR family regulator
MTQILLIEPDRVLAKTYAETLIAAGYHVMAAATAQSAIMLADSIRPDLVILELQLVEHSGIEFLYEFRSYGDWQHIPVLVHSHVPPAEFNDAAEQMKTELGVYAYLYKPHTSLRELLATVSQYKTIAA